MEYAELGWQEAVVLGCAKQERLLEAVADGSRSADEVARWLGLSPRAVHALLSALAEIGVLAEDKDRFRLIEEHRGPLLDLSHPEYAGGFVVHRYELIRKWGQMPKILKTGSPIEDDPAQGSEGKETFIYSMRRLAKPGVREVAAILLSRLPKNAHILDVGGGPGTYAEAFVEGGARVTVFDLPEVIELMKERLSAAGVSAVGGDFNEGLPEGPFDAAYLGSVSHIYGPRGEPCSHKASGRIFVPWRTDRHKGLHKRTEQRSSLVRREHAGQYGVREHLHRRGVQRVARRSRLPGS